MNGCHKLKLDYKTVISEEAVESDVALVVKKYADINEKVFMTLDEATALSKALAASVAAGDFQANYIIGIANGALLPTHVVANELELPFEYIRMRRQGSRWKRRAAKIPGFRWLFSTLFRLQLFARLVAPLIDSVNKLESERVEQNTKPHEGRDILLVDDAIDSGQSIAAAVDMLMLQGARNVKVAVISWSKRLDSEQIHGVVPDYVMNRRLQHYPWSENNPQVHDYRRWLGEQGLEEWD